mmetsp:Transcript_23139/g.62048  ORF Transcript_23139/g.62048 Transcript_23139/m.62048 type:complete len:249 (-) Transcript_23139:180-926(-)
MLGRAGNLLIGGPKVGAKWPPPRVYTGCAPTRVSLRFAHRLAVRCAGRVGRWRWHLRFGMGHGAVTTGGCGGGQARPSPVREKSYRPEHLQQLRHFIQRSGQAEMHTIMPLATKSWPVPSGTEAQSVVNVEERHPLPLHHALCQLVLMLELIPAVGGSICHDQIVQRRWGRVARLMTAVWDGCQRRTIHYSFAQSATAASQQRCEATDGIVQACKKALVIHIVRTSVENDQVGCARCIRPIAHGGGIE